MSARDRLKRFVKVANKSARRYQVDAALEGLALLKNGGFVLKLPQGTGKSLVSQLVVRARLDADGATRTKALVIAPTIELRKQYARLGDWFREAAGASPKRLVVEIDDSMGGNPDDFLLAVRSRHLLVTTPKFLANRLHLMRDVWKQIDVCVLDEVDLWSIVPLDKGDVRVHRHMETIFPELLKWRIPILGLTATPLSDETKSLLAQFGCTRECVVPPERIAQFLPSSRIVIVPCLDVELVRRSGELSEEIEEAELKLKHMLGDHITDIYVLVMQHCWSRDSVGALAQKIRTLWGRRTRLHEDVDDQGRGLRRRSGKQQALVSILREHKSVVVYGREVELVEHLGALNAGNSRIGYAHAEEQYRANIARFQNGELNALAMTRALGLRGLDFPDADSMVLYSAKRDWRVMDQEMCRIRSQRHHRPRKPIYVLCYSRTYEMEKVDRVVNELTRVTDGQHARYLVRTSKEVQFLDDHDLRRRQ